MKLKYKFTIFMSLGTVIVSVLMGTMITNTAKKMVQKGVGESQLELARYSMKSLDRLMYERYLDIEAMAEEMEHYIFNKEIDGNNIFLAGERLKKIKRTSGKWQDLSLVSREGLVLASTNKVINGEKIDSSKNPNGYAAYQAALEGDIYYSDLVKSEFIERETLLFSAPVRNSEKWEEINGVVVGYFSWPVVLEMFEEIGGPLIHLYNDQGWVILTNNPTHRDGILVNNHSDKLSVQYALSGSSGFENLENVHGEELALTAYTNELGHLDYEGNNWGLVTEVPVEIVYAQSRESARNILLITIPMIIAFSGSIFWLILRTVMYPIAELTEMSEAIVVGDLSKRVERVGKDEIGRLGTIFNQMTNRLQKLLMGLENKIKEKTKEYEEKNQELKKMNKLMIGRELKMAEMKKTFRQTQDSTSRFPDDIGDEQVEDKAPNEGERLETPISGEMSKEKPEE